MGMMNYRCLVLVQFALLAPAGGFAGAPEPAPKASLAGCLSALNFYDGTDYPSLQFAGKHPIVPGRDALGRRGFYVYTVGTDTADFHQLPPFAGKKPYDAVVVEKNQDATTYYFNLQVGDEKLPILYHDPKRAGQALYVETANPGFAPLTDPKMKGAALVGTGQDAVSPQTQATLIAYTQARLSHLADNYKKQRRAMVGKVLANSDGRTPTIVNEIAMGELVLKEKNENIAKYQSDPHYTTAGLEQLTRQRDDYAQLLNNKKAMVEHRGLVRNYVYDQNKIKRLQKLSDDAVAACKVRPIDDTARRMEFEMDAALREKIPEYKGASRVDKAG